MTHVPVYTRAWLHNPWLRRSLLVLLLPLLLVPLTWDLFVGFLTVAGALLGRFGRGWLAAWYGVPGL